MSSYMWKYLAGTTKKTFVDLTGEEMVYEEDACGENPSEMSPAEAETWFPHHRPCSEAPAPTYRPAGG